jgi:hypothetical protein
MSWGMCICSVCKREVHQDGAKDAQGRTRWTHCEDKTPICEHGLAEYAQDLREVKGKYCGRDGIPRSTQWGV